jgi:MFS family permease
MPAVTPLLRVLRSRNYRLFFAGQALTVIGMWMQMTAQQWLMYRLTDSAFAVALLAAAQTGPGLFVGPFAGALADRHSRRRLLMVLQALSLFPAFALALLTLAGWISPLQIVLLALASGVLRAAEIPIRQSFVPELVERESLPNAIALNSALFNSARVVGPALAGAMLMVASEGWCFLVNAISFLGPIAALSAMRLPAPQLRPHAGRSMLSDVLEGVRYVRGEPFVRTLLLGLAVAAACGSYTVLFPGFASEVLRGASGTFSALTSAVGVGSIATALVLASRQGTAGLERVTGLGYALLGAAILLLSLATSVGVALPLAALVGAGTMALFTSTNTLLQLSVPDQLRGRVMSLHSALFLGMTPLGSLAAGQAADAFGATRALAGCGALVLAASLYFGRQLLRHARPSEAIPLEAAPAALDVDSGRRRSSL